MTNIQFFAYFYILWSTQTSQARGLSAEPETIQTPEKRKNKKSRSAERKKALAAIGGTIDSDYANLTPETDTMEVATSDNEPIPKHRKRHRDQAAAVGKKMTRHQRRNLEAAHARNHQHLRRIPLTLGHRTTPDRTPRLLHRTTHRTTRKRLGYWHGPRSNDATLDRSINVPRNSGRERKPLLTSERADNSSAWKKRWPPRFSLLRDLRTCRATFLQRPVARNPERSHQHQIDRAQDFSHYRNEWNAPLRASQVHQHPSQHVDRAASCAAAISPAPRTRARDSPLCKHK
jgi:hypothetical protein